MRTLWTGLALAALVAACTDQPTTPLAPEPQLAKVEAPQLDAGGGGNNGALIWRFLGSDGFCWFWDAEGKDIPPVPCQIVFRNNGSFTWKMSASGIPNPFGKAVHFGPTNYPQAVADFYKLWYDVEPVDGELPLCDWNVLADPELNWLVCTTNWHSTISASGEGTLTWIVDPEHSWTKWVPFPW